MAAPYAQPGYPGGPQPGYPGGPQPGYPGGAQPGYAPPAQGYPPAAAAPPAGYPPNAGGQPGGMPPAAPTAPTFGTIAGYESIGGQQGVIAAGPPPAFIPQNQPAERPVEVFDKAAAITEEEATEALHNFVAENCCFGKSPAHEMKIRSMQSSSAFHYKMESFVESRSFKWHQEPYTGQPIDGPQNGLAPPAWSIYVEQPPHFKPKETFMEIPHTASVVECYICRGRGTTECKHCRGDGIESCTHCKGNGDVDVQGQRVECTFCRGRGCNDCTHCKGHGKVTCTVCNGNRRMKNYLRLTVQWKVETGEHVVEKSALPDELITQVAGMQIFSQEFPRVFPLTSFFVQEVNTASQRIVENHKALANTNIVHRQRHDLRSVPVNEVIVTWKEQDYKFWAYGAEKKVYCPDYPQQCCWGCSIL